MATLYQHPRAPVVFTRARPAGCIGRCPVCSPTCAYPVTEQSLSAALAARLLEWRLLILQRMYDYDEVGARIMAHGMEPADAAQYLIEVDRLAALWAKGAQ